jgi:protein TonB
MDNKHYLFAISGLISISLFAFTFSLFLFVIFSSDKNKVYALNKDNYISVSIDLPESMMKKTRKSNDLTINNTPASKDIDIGDLFSDVWTKNIEQTNKQPNENKRLQEIQKRIKKIENKNISSAVSKLSDMQLSSSEDEASTASSGEEVNEYFGKIQALVYEHFYPPQNSEGYSVKAVIELSSFGKVLDFRILNYSTNDALNRECDKIKSRLMGVLFPVNPENKAGHYVVILKSKG